MSASNITAERREKQRTYNKKWREAHPDVFRARMALWREKNQEKIKGYALARSLDPAYKEKAREKAKAYSENNKLKVLAKHKRYRDAAPHKSNFHCALRRARKKQASPAWADHSLIKEIYRRASEIRKTGKDVHVDHIYPIAGKLVCGLHVHNNLQIIEAHINRKKMMSAPDS